MLEDWYTTRDENGTIVGQWRNNITSSDKSNSLPPLAVERLCDVTWQVQELLSTHGVDSWLIFGSLLGAYRDHAHIKSEWDVDICVNDQHAELATRVLMRSKFAKSAQNKRTVFPFRPSGFMIATFLDDYDDTMDVESSWIPMQSMWMRQSKLVSDVRVGRGVPREWTVPFSTASKLHVSVRIDSSVRSGVDLTPVETCYGNVWRTKKHEGWFK